jgi:endonuclease/exonuclease/phosphatase family metal-dependent hydrolase
MKNPMARTALLTALAVCVALGSLSACRDAATTHSTINPPPPAERATLTVLTYNVNYGISGDRETIDLLRAQDADVVFLQETTDAWEAALRRDLGERYPHVAFKHCCGAGGLGVMSKHPFETREYIAPPEGGWFPAWRFIVHAPIGSFQALNVHLRPQLSDSGSLLTGMFLTPPIRLAEIETYYPKLDPSLPTLVVGDFNENGRGGAIRFLEDRGFRSALPAASGAAPTWRWQTSLGEISEQLDHLVFDARLEVVDVRVVDGGRSDHLPVVARVRAREQR